MNESLTFLVEWSLKATVTVGLGLLCTVALRKQSAATRHLLWRIALAAITLLPVAMFLSTRVNTPQVMEPVQAPIRSTFVVRPSFVSRSFVPRSQFTAKVLAADSEDASWVPAAAVIYLVGAFVMFGVWGSGYSRVRRMASTASPRTGQVRVTVDKALRVPVTFGVLEPIILLPGESWNWPPERVDAAIRHETAHIWRRDWAWQSLAAWVRAIHWFNPLVWVLAAALTRTAEAAADDEVLASGLSASVYAGELLKVAEGARGSLVSATPMARRAGLRERLQRIVQDGVDRRRPARVLALSLTAVFAGGAILIAAGARKTLPKFTPPAPFQFGPVESEARLSNGVKVRLVYLTGPDLDGVAWRPDGTPATQADRDLFKSATPPRKSPIDGRVVVAYYIVTGYPEGHFSPGVEFTRDDKPAFGPASLWIVENDRSYTLCRIAYTIPSGARAAKFGVGVASAPFNTLGVLRPGDGQLGAKVGEREIDTTYDKDPILPWKLIESHHYDPQNTTLRFVAPASVDGQQLIVNAYDSDGKEVRGGGWSGPGNVDPSTGGHLWEFNFGAPPKQIDHFVVRARSFGWANLKGVHLQPLSRP